MWETRELNDLIIETQSNRTFRGQLGAISVEPTMDVLLVSRSVQEPLQELDSRGTWVPLTQWSILVPEGNIRTVHAVRVLEEKILNDSKDSQPKVKISFNHAEESWKGTKVDQKVVLIASGSAPTPKESPQAPLALFMTTAEPQTAKAKASQAKASSR